MSLRDPLVALAENLCRRLGDVVFYAAEIGATETGWPPIEGAYRVTSLLVGYFSACKSVLDAGAIALADLYQVGAKSRGQVLQKGNLDLWRGPFRGTLAAEYPAIGQRYDAKANLYREITEWRDAAVHRVAPFVIASSQGATVEGMAPETHPHMYKPRVVGRPDTRIDWLLDNPGHGLWVEPLYFHARWYGQLVDFCAEVCRDIGDNA